MLTSDLGGSRPASLLHPNRISIAQIDALIAARLGPARVRGNAQPAVLLPTDRDVSSEEGWWLERRSDRTFLQWSGSFDRLPRGGKD